MTGRDTRSSQPGQDLGERTSAKGAEDARELHRVRVLIAAREELAEQLRANADMSENSLQFLDASFVEETTADIELWRAAAKQLDEAEKREERIVVAANERYLAAEAQVSVLADALQVIAEEARVQGQGDIERWARDALAHKPAAPDGNKEA